MDKILQQLKQLKQEQQELKTLKTLECKEQLKYIQNCKTLLQVHKQKKTDHVTENMIQINETLRAITTDVQGFKSIRQKLFIKASQDKDPQNKLYLYLFHLFESLVCNINTLVIKQTQQILNQCPQEVIGKLRDIQNSINNDSMINLSNVEGFFQENFKQMVKSQRQIEQVVETLIKDSDIQQRKFEKQKSAFESFLKELQHQQVNQSVDNSFEVRWSLQELENIVYDFLHFNALPLEFQKNKLSHFQDVQKDDILKVLNAEQLSTNCSKDEVLPDMIRDYILHDRGNSLFLGDSFANLPSPVNESQTIKQLFKPKDDKDDDQKFKDKQLKDKDENVKIKIEGKDLNDSEESKSVVDINVDDIDKVVFNNNQEQIKRAQAAYKEEDSYVNPADVTYSMDLGYKIIDNLESLSQTVIHQEFIMKPVQNNKKISEEAEQMRNFSSQLDRDTIKINQSDIQIKEGQLHQANKFNYHSVVEGEGDYKGKRAQEYNPYVPVNRNFINKNLSINILDQHSSMISNSDESNQSSKNIAINQRSTDSEPVKPKGINYSRNTQELERSRSDTDERLSIQQNLVNRFLQEMSQNSHSSSIRIDRTNKTSLKNIERELQLQQQNIQRQEEISKLDISYEDEHSSCKDTIKMSQQREFSFFRDGSRKDAASNNTNTSRYEPKQFINQQLSNVQDTVTRIQGLNTSQNAGYNNPQILKAQKQNPFKIDSVTVTESSKINSNQSVEQSAYQNNISTDIPQIKLSNHKNKFAKRSISPINYVGKSMQDKSVIDSQDNMNRCVSQKAIGNKQSSERLPYQTHNVPQSIKNSHSNYDVSTMDGGNGMLTPSIGTQNNHNSQYNSVQQLSKDPSKKSIASLQQRYKFAAQNQSVQKSNYLRGFEDKLDVQPNLRNIDALKMILSKQEGQLSGRNYISVPANNSQQNDFQNKLSYRGGIKGQQEKKCTPITERNDYKTRESNSNQISSGSAGQNSINYSKNMKRKGTKDGRKKSKKSRSKVRDRDQSQKKNQNEAINMSALPSITRNLGYQL
ncbi:UNKNOWN [Stylonychia lemnae]|uniref:Uncharacterized protein n=1 Tax=Stylonychia lemnae TaxID=5949 RepID=A0A077ZM92_STYLE|nr:UNKNOWN [Stylonychia lemnae]|eukprot:CDW71107.1 UNKNOWN [Stylonychia lemnae]